MTQKKKSRIAGALEASILEEMMDDSGHQVEFSKFCLQHYLNEKDINLEKTAMLCENFVRALISMLDMILVTVVK